MSLDKNKWGGLTAHAYHDLPKWQELTQATATSDKMMMKNEIVHGLTDDTGVDAKAVPVVTQVELAFAAKNQFNKRDLRCGMRHQNYTGRRQEVVERPIPTAAPSAKDRPQCAKCHHPLNALCGYIEYETTWMENEQERKERHSVKLRPGDFDTVAGCKDCTGEKLRIEFKKKPPDKATAPSRIASDGKPQTVPSVRPRNRSGHVRLCLDSESEASKMNSCELVELPYAVRMFYEVALVRQRALSQARGMGR